MSHRLIHGFFYLILAALLIAPAAAEPPPPRYVQFNPITTKAALYYPDPDVFPEPHIAILAVHRIFNFMSHSVTRQMPRLGILAMGLNSRCENNEAICTAWSDIALDIKQAVEYLRSLPGIDTVILVGDPVPAFYQAVAEAGVSHCQQPQKLTRCSNALAELPPADAMIYWDPHLGNAVNDLRGLNPAVVNDAEILNDNALPVIDPALDPFNPENGYNPDGVTRYSEAFKETYFKAQARRMNRLIDLALERRRQMREGSYAYPSTAFNIPQFTDFPRLMNIDTSIQSGTEQPRKLLKNDGSIEDCCIVESIRRVNTTGGGLPNGTIPGEIEEVYRGPAFQSVESFLGVRAIRSTDSMTGIEYCSANNSNVCNVREIHVPVLIIVNQGHDYIRHGEVLYENLASEDKDYIAIEGSTHRGIACVECMPEGRPYDGRWDNAEQNLFNYVRDWINARFSGPRTARARP